MSLLVTGSIGIDTVRTPYGLNENCIGGSAIYFSLAAGLFVPVKLIGVVGEDCPFNMKEIFENRQVDLSGLEVRRGSKTFRWHGVYEGSMNEAQTKTVQLNVLAEAPPQVPESCQDCGYIFLANTAPSLQNQLLGQFGHPKFVAADTMNLWIETANADLRELMERIDMLVLNEGEAEMLTGHHNLVSAAKSIIKMGPRFVVIKKGEHGSLLYDHAGNIFVLPAFPTDIVVDPTGAGDSFAGGMMGYLSQFDSVDFFHLQQAIAYGTVTASFTIQDFSIHALQKATLDKIEQRLETFRKVTQF